MLVVSPFCIALQTATSCKAKGAPSCDTHGVDLSKSDEVRKFARDVLDKYKNVDVLVNNAGMGPSSGSGPIKGMIPTHTTCVNCRNCSQHT